MLKRFLVDRRHVCCPFITVICHSELYRLILAMLRLKCRRSGKMIAVATA
ncbi:MAG: hypothetical protein ACTS73_04760 [Arsenophonus sp. NEOnobi-MAG3]